MISVLINLIFIVAIVWQYSKDKPTIGIFLLLTILSPRIAVGSIRIDGTYLVIIIVAIAVFIKDSARIYKFEGYFKKYVILIICINVLYLISWTLFNRNDTNRLISTLAGALKHIVLFYEIVECNKNIKELDLNKEIISYITVAAIVNFVALLYEIIDAKGATSLLSNVFFNEEESAYIAHQVHNDGFARYYGLFSYPMGMGMFICYSIAYLINNNTINGMRKACLLALLLVLGIYSASKSFIIGTAIVLITYLLLSLFSKTISKKDIRSVGILFAVIIGIFGLYNQIYNFIYDYIGPGFARYFGYLKNVQGILYARLDSQDGSLLSTMKVIKDYWLLGVGPTSIANEPVMDNSYIVIFHNGGIIALISIIGFYCMLFIKSKQRKDLLLLTVAILATGMGFPTMFISDISFWVMTVILWELSYDKNIT